MGGQLRRPFKLHVYLYKNKKTGRVCEIYNKNIYIYVFTFKTLNKLQSYILGGEF